VLPEHPFASVTVTVKVFAVFTVIHCVVAPVLQLYETSPAGAHICVELPEQNASVPLMDGVGFGLTVVVADVEPEHPLPSVTVTVNVFAVLTIIHCVVAPVLQLYETSPAGAHICVELPEQNESVPLMDGVGLALTVVVADVEPEHPFASVTVTVKVFAVFTVIHCVVAPVLQLYETSPAGAHICVELPEQNESVPLIDGVGLGLTVVVADVLPEQPFASVTVTVKVFAVFTVIHCVVAPVLQL
jgi:hypothetical protein